MTVKSLKRRMQQLLHGGGTCPACGGHFPDRKERAYLRRVAEPPEHGQQPYFGNPCTVCQGHSVLPKQEPPHFG